MDLSFDPSLVLYLPLYELDGASFMSKDAYGHLCTRTGALWTPQGHSFDGIDDYIISASLSGQPTGNSSFTLVAWGKFNALTGNRVLVSFGVDSSSPTAYGLYGAGAIMRAAFASGYGIVDATTGLVTGQWYCVHVVYDTTTNKIYLNGVLEGTTNYSAASLSAGDVRIGQWVNGTSALNGSVGEVLLYNRALNPLEIQRNYLATKWRYR